MANLSLWPCVSTTEACFQVKNYLSSTPTQPVSLQTRTLTTNPEHTGWPCTLNHHTKVNSLTVRISSRDIQHGYFHSEASSYNTRAASCGKYHIQFSRLNQQRNSFSCFGAKAWNCLPSQVCNLPKLAFKKPNRKALFAALEGEEDYIEAPNLLCKINLYFT